MGTRRATPQRVTIPALMIAAPASGAGKTLVTAAIARWHARAGRRVQVFKIGPDFLDPMVLERASGRPVHNLDLWMVGEAECRRLLARAAMDSELVLVEAMMGLYDGSPSAAELARRFRLPIVSVIDASAVAQTFGAIAHGLASFDPALVHHGVLANRVAGPSHACMLRGSLREPARWLGAIAHDPAWHLPERHLGLALPHETADLDRRLDAAADAIGRTALATLPTAVALESAEAADPPARSLAGRRVAIARDAAFCFLYPANVECLRELGAEIAFFSPLADSRLPACDAIYLPGGYPELHASELSANAAMRDAMREAFAANVPMLAECGGMMALFEDLVDAQGRTHPVWGLIPGRVTMQPRLAAIGLQAYDCGTGTLRGHTFHHSRAHTPLEPVCVATPHPAGVAGEAVYRTGSLTASYVHAYFPSNAGAVARLFGADAA